MSKINKKIEQHCEDVENVIKEIKGGLAKWECIIDEENKTKTFKREE